MMGGTGYSNTNNSFVTKSPYLNNNGSKVMSANGLSEYNS